jgi:hypothetical protein
MVTCAAATLGFHPAWPDERGRRRTDRSGAGRAMRARRATNTQRCRGVTLDIRFLFFLPTKLDLDTEPQYLALIH